MIRNQSFKLGGKNDSEVVSHRLFSSINISKVVFSIRYNSYLFEIEDSADDLLLNINKVPFSRVLGSRLDYESTDLKSEGLTITLYSKKVVNL